MKPPSKTQIALYKWRAALCAHESRLARAKQFADDSENPADMLEVIKEAEQIKGMVSALKLFGHTIEDADRAVDAVVKYKSYNRDYKIEWEG